MSANDLNHDLDDIGQWAQQCKLEFNPDPTKQAIEALFSCKKSNPNHPQIMFNGTVVEKMNDQNHLGLILESSLSFKKYLNEEIIKAKTNIGIIKHLLIFLPHKTPDLIISNVYSSCPFPSWVLWHNIWYTIMADSSWCGLKCPNGKTERMQYQAALAITGVWQGPCRSKLSEELGWESLSDRHWHRRILQIHRIVSDKTPSYLKNKLPRLRRQLYRQSNRNTFHELKCKFLWYTSSFFPDAITSWNNVITHDIPFSVFLKTIFYLWFVQRKNVFLVYIIL